MSIVKDFFLAFIRDKGSKKQPKEVVYDNTTTGISPGRVSQPEDYSFLDIIKGMTGMVTPSFPTEVIPLIRDLYKVNPDVMIAIQDMFKLANTGHVVSFPYNTDEESSLMNEHLARVSKNWSNYTAGIDGLVNKMMVQALVGGAISIEAVPDINLNGIKTILFINPESILFKRDADGTYLPYQKTKYLFGGKVEPYIPLNTSTFKYTAMFNDTDEPYGIPPFIAALPSLKTQNDMKTNINNIMELMGLIGFLEAKMQKPDKQANEKSEAYALRLTDNLKKLKVNLMSGIKEGVVTGYIDDHEFKLNTTSTNLDNVDKLWDMNQQSLANGLGTSGSIIGVNTANTEGGSGILLSKLISELKNIQMMASSELGFIYRLELILAGFDVKTVKVSFLPSTISDDLKVQQAQEIRIRNQQALYDQGITSQNDFAFATGYSTPDKLKPRVSRAAKTNTASSTKSTSPIDEAKKKQVRKTGKSTSDRKSRTKDKVIPKRKDQNPKIS